MKIEFKKPTKKQVMWLLRYALIVVFGNALTAAAAAFFIVPNGFTMGGTTGLGTFVRNLLVHNGKTNMEWVVSLTVWVANIALFILGTIFLGKKFAVAALAGTVLYPSFLSGFQEINSLFFGTGEAAIAHDNQLLAAICGALLFGAGVGTCVRVGASTGGTDIPPLIFHKLFNIPVSVTLWILDLTIVFIQIFAHVGVEMILYGVIITLLSSFVIGMVSPIGMRRAQVKIISKKYREIREMILNKLNRGVTLLYGKTGFLQEKCYVVLTVVSNRDIVKLKNEVQLIDPEAFLMISVISEVRGRGFSQDRIALPKEVESHEDLTVVSNEEFEKATPPDQQ